MSSSEKRVREFHSWPRWPYLPLRRRGDLCDKNLGVLLADKHRAAAVKDEGPVVVYHVNLFMLPRSPEAWAAAPKTEYESVPAMLADGWEID